MANEYIINKWKLWFRSININHRGTISRSDVRQENDTFATLSQLDDEGRKKFHVIHSKLWEEYIFRGNSGPITEKDFIDMNIRDYTASKEKFVQGMRKAFTAVYDLIDVNQEGSISKREFNNILRANGHDNAALNEKFFNDFNPVDGKISNSIIVDYWLQFTSSDDSSKKDIIKEALESGL